ncbi:MAG TPA: hypothetical protein VFX35_02365, partial [Solirubrobacterales bacterium]|nr:hypothetical protein [Solirubrobacterales bacterium]
PAGTAAGQINEPTSIATAPNGNVWVTERGNRVQAFSESGSFIRGFGSAGAGDGQFNLPVGVEVDNAAHVWVLDQKNSRIQEFTENGRFLGKFGSQGTGAGQFSLSNPAGIASDGEGHLWITDWGNNRVQGWSAFSFQTNAELLPTQPPDDPEVSMTNWNGLVTSVVGEGAGTNTYSYSGDDLVANKGPEGETKFQYDAGGRMTRVELPNGTVATVAYDTTFHRVTSLTVDPAGAEPAKTTTFSYTNDPRKTVVTPSDASAITYEFAADGSIFKWWNIVKGGPELSLAGTLWVNQEKEITVGLHNLEIQADAVEGVSSIQVIANGDTVVEERTCDQDPATPGVDCLHQVDEWVVETGSLKPGVMNLEVVAKDRIGNISSKRFWVTVPYTPPPNPEDPPKPTFSQIKTFREEFGLDLDLNASTSQQELNNRIYDLLGAWGNPQTPDGEVARSSSEKWGVPMRPIDVAEMEYRERYIDQAASAIPAWAAAHAPGSYAGYFVDHRHGGIIHVGFTSNQSSLVASLKAEAGLMAPARVTTFDTVPQHPLVQDLGKIATEIPQLVVNRPDINAILAKSELDVPGNRVVVSSTQPATASAYFSSVFGASAPIVVKYVQEKPRLRARSRGVDKRLYAGDWISAGPWDCTLGFGASEDRGVKPNGESQTLEFGLTAGHCWQVGTEVDRVALKSDGSRVYISLGVVKRRAYSEVPNGIEKDGEAILLNGIETPRWIYWSQAVQYRVGGAEAAIPGSTLCTSGTYGGVDCGIASAPFAAYNTEGGPAWVVESSAVTTTGDSGGPVWNIETGKAVGLVEGGYGDKGPTWFTPLKPVPLPNGTTAPGLLEEMDAAGGGPFNIAK